MTVIGVDLGGTHVRIVALDASAHIFVRRKILTEAARGADHIIGAILSEILAIGAQKGVAPLRALGIGVTGPVDMATGIVSNPYTLCGWPPTDLRSPFSVALGVPVVIDNDANVAAVGEWWRGAGAGCRRMTMVTVGTGIGVATLIDGVVQRATNGRHGEAGHMILDPRGPDCYCGAKGCWEVLGSGTSLHKQAQALARESLGMLRDLAGGDPDKATADHVFAVARAGDSAAAAVVDDFANWLGRGLVNLASTVMPDVFVLSGGVMAHFDLIEAKITSVLRRHAVMIPTEIAVVAATLGDVAGAVGAARLALDQTAL